MATDDPAEAIRRRMAELRRELAFDVRDVGRSARAMANLSFFVRQFPWATMALAAAAGYMLVPKKKEVVYPDPHTLAELVRKQQIRVDTSKAAKESRGMLQSLVLMGVTWAARVGANYMMQQLTTPGVNKEQEPSKAHVSPVEESWKTKR